MTERKENEPVGGVLQVGDYEIEYREDSEGVLQPLTDAPLSLSETMDLAFKLAEMTKELKKSRAVE